MEIIGGIIVLGIIAVFITAAVAVGIGLKKLFNKGVQLDRERAIERDMRQAIKDREIEKKVAEKILRERGH